LEEFKRANEGGGDAARKLSELQSKTDAEIKKMKEDLDKADKTRKDLERKMKKKYDDDMAEKDDLISKEKSKADRADKKVKKLEADIKTLRK